MQAPARFGEHGKPMNDSLLQATQFFFFCMLPAHANLFLSQDRHDFVSHITSSDS